MEAILNSLAQVEATHCHVFTEMLRWLMPILAGILVLRCAAPLLTFRREPEIWAWLCLSDGKRLAVTHWESVIGRSKRSDIVIQFPTVSRSHAVLTRYDDGSWTIFDADSKGGIQVNGRKVSIHALQPEDIITIGGIDMMLQPISHKQEQRLAQNRTQAASTAGMVANVLLLTVIQCLFCISYLLGSIQRSGMEIMIGFGGLILCQWLLLTFYLCIRRRSFEAESIAFFLCTLGMVAIAAVKPGEAVKQLIAMVIGIAAYLLIGWSMRDLQRAKKVRYLAAVAGVGFLVITLLFGKEYYGAKNWLIIGSLSLQPSELSKVCFVFAGASTMDRLLKKRNIILFIAYSVLICGCLALMNDFGTALIFFCAFLIIAFLRSGSIGTIGLACTALGFAGVIALKIAPHAMRRFSAWRHVWEYPLSTGYQQTKSMMCIAAGGMLGLGAGNGWMKNMFAADSDVVFATVCEEWGMIVALLPVVCIVALAVFAVRSAAVARSSFYTIGSCTAASILVVQVILNMLGTVDVVPLTGVTFPFLSNGGTSMIGAWGLLAFVKAADTRQNASFAVRLAKQGRDEDE
ncbi:MAG: FtsW/RodA/SpoVE family cell cycle protein [Oscillospiraceae bacterium]|nr:FtsW/RodA/SpoVE family cell cycle protein [Oscillospiraceae bacterium]MBQ9837990.1 FtsW/RodA/SpoVE family cell cycle protein [Oscillospiraceae bacterium]